MSLKPYSFTASSPYENVIYQQNSQFIKNKNRSLVKEIDAITNASERISFAKNIIQKHSVSSRRKKTLFELLQFIEKRTTNATLYLAILGEFSSGKSTFINALLRQR